MLLTELRGRDGKEIGEGEGKLPPSGKRAPTLRHRVLVFALAAALPLLLLAGGAVWQQNRAERLRAEEGLVARTHAMALLLDREFAGAERLLRALSGSPSLARGELPTFWSEMRSAGAAYGARAINLIGPDGRIRLSTSWLPGERSGVQSTGPASEALATGRSVVSNLFVSPSLSEWSVAVAVPTQAPAPDGSGLTRHVLGLVIPRERLLSTLTEQRLPPGAMASALDRELTIVARTARDREMLATKPPPEVLAAIGPRDGIIPPYAVAEGERVRAAYATATQSGYRVKISVPEATFEAPLREALLPTLLIGAGLLVLALVFGVLFADRLSRSLRRLGEPETAGGAAIREIDELGLLLARRAEARERAAAEARALFDASPVGVVRSDAGGRVTDANDAFLRVVGMTRVDLAAGRVRWDDLTPPEWIGRDELAIAEAARNGACAPYQKEYVRPDGTRVPVLMFFAFHDRAAGAASAFVVDLSGWETTEAALARAHEQMRLAMGAARIFSWDWNVVSGAVQWSAGLEAALGMPEGSFGGTVEDFRAMVHPEDLPRVEAALRAALADEAPYDAEFRMRRADGGERWVVARGTVLRDGTGRPTRMIGIDFDITDRKRAELALAESKAALRRITEAGQVATFEVEEPGAGGLARVSPGFRALYGLPPDAPCDFPAVLGRVHPADRAAFLADHLRLATEGGRFDGEFRILLPDGATRWIHSMGEADPGAGGMPARLRGVAFDITSRKQAEAGGGGRPRDLLETLDLGTFMARDLEGTIRYWSVGCERLYGWTAEEAIGRISHDLLGTVFPVPLSEIEAALVGDGAWAGDLRQRTRAGEEVVIAASKALRRAPDGSPALVLEALVDVTAQREAERALRESEATLSAVLDALPVGVAIADARGEIVRDNQALRDLWGVPPRTERWEDYANWVAWWPETGERIGAEAWGLTRAIAHGEVTRDELVECQRFGSEERRFFLNNAAPIRDGAGRIIGSVAAALDITERRAAELRLQESAERLRLAQEAAAMGVWEWDVASGVQRWSDREFALHGLDPSSATACFETWYATLHPEDRERAEGEIERALREGGELRTDYRVVLPGGELRWLAGRGIVLPAHGGTGQRVVGVNIDVTEGKALEARLVRANAELEGRVAERTQALSEAAEELRAEMRRREQTQTALVQAQKLEALGQLTGSVAHDFNNVLAAVMGSLRLIGRRAGGNEEILALAQSGEQAAERAAALIRQLMAFARREDMVPAVVGPGRVLKEVDQMLRRSVGTGVTLLMDADPGTWPVLADPNRLEIALLNLAVNARDAMEGVGSLVVEARNVAAPAGAALPDGLDPRQDYVVVSARDSGPGMSPEVLARASEPFFTTKPRGQGTGLGLAMVQGFARQSGGVFRLLSKPGEGTTAEIWLPRAAGDEPAGAAGAEIEPDSSLHGSATILVVDDDDQVRLVTATQLRDLGYEVIEAAGLSSAMVQASAAGRLDLVVTDVTMPGGRGPDLALRLRATRPGIPILFVSGYGDPGALASEMVLAKPFTPNELSRRVLAALGRVPAPLHERMLMRLSRPELRGAYLAWRGLRNAAGGDGLPRPEVLDIAGLDGAEHAFTVVLDGGERSEPLFRLVQVGAALERRLGRLLAGEETWSEESGGELESDEVFGGLGEAYRRCARLGVPFHDYARFGFGDGGHPLYFERLLLPLAIDGGSKPTHLLGLAFFSDAA